MKGSLRENHTPTRHVRITILLRLVGFTSTSPSSEVSNMFSPGGVWENVHRCRSEAFTPTFSSRALKSSVQAEGQDRVEDSRLSQVCVQKYKTVPVLFSSHCVMDEMWLFMCLQTTKIIQTRVFHMYHVDISTICVTPCSLSTIFLQTKRFFDNINRACLWSRVAFLFKRLFSEQFSKYGSLNVERQSTAALWDQTDRDLKDDVRSLKRRKGVIVKYGGKASVIDLNEL